MFVASQPKLLCQTALACADIRAQKRARIGNRYLDFGESIELSSERATLSPTGGSSAKWIGEGVESHVEGEPLRQNSV